ncbi:methyltransferase family protein [Evansella tamaricis]|uniref:Isoprenylcysteine carboxylmethyltransferase family protein n=1 Tax=Evansella tamaricis TaxID=2069301 RepID=A0ABS6JA74_9BACI|nr:isoprenylcysteine carboxylmethyltransferase family protein [Evansella tamaricis]MBU9710579.1 isoprenylcysteine carboxylmethyltransferase family protein [Evansella tamaricis]
MGNQSKTTLLSHIISILLLPFNVTVIIPSILIYFLHHTVLWGQEGSFSILLLLFGIVITLFGFFLVIVTVLQFAKKGKGTLAPWNPPKKLVVSGPYRHTRNPMISGVAFILLGESLIVGSLPLLFWFLFFTVVNYVYFIVREEPLLEKKFGEEYVEYKKNVPRLFPRRTRWSSE